MATKTEGIRIILKDKETDKPLGGIPVNIKVSANNFEKTKKTDNKWGEATFETKEGFDTGETITIIVNPGAYFGYEEVRPGSSAALPGLVIIRRYSLGPSDKEEEPEEDKRVEARIKRLKRTHSKRRPGEEQTISFGLQNRGSKSHKFYISAAVSSPQQAVHTSDTEFVRQDYTDQVTMPVKIPPDMPPGRKTITVSVFEDKEHKIEKDTKTTTFTVQGEPTTAPKTFCEYVNKAYKKVTLIYMQMAVGDWMAGKITTKLRDKAVTGFQNSTVFEECTAEKWAIITELKVNKTEVAPGERPLVRFTVKNTGKQKTDILFRWGLETPSTSWRIDDVVPNTHRGGTFQPPAKTQEGEYRIKCETKIDGTKTHEASVSYEVKEEKADIGAEIKDVSFPSGTDFISPGRAVAYATVTNIGAKDHTFALGMSLINGQTIDGAWRKVELFAEEEGKEKIVTLGIVIPPNVPSGSYTIKTAIWKDWEGGKENEEEDGFEGGKLIDMLDSDSKSATIKASDVPEPPEPERPTTEPQMSWWDDFLSTFGLRKMPDEVGQQINGTLVLLGGAFIEVPISTACTLATGEFKGSIKHTQCMSNPWVSWFIEDYWAVAYGKTPGGLPVDPTDENRGFLALSVLPLGRLTSSGGSYLLKTFKTMPASARALFGPGLSKIWKSFPILNKAKSQAIKASLDDQLWDNALKILEVGELVTPAEWGKILRANPEVLTRSRVWAVKDVPILSEKSIKAGVDFTTITADDIARSSAYWAAWYAEMLKIIPYNKLAPLMKKLGIDLEIIKTQLGSVAYKTGITEWDDVIKQGKKIGLTEEDIAVTFKAFGKDPISKAVLKGEISNWKSAWKWAMRHKTGIISATGVASMFAWYVGDNIQMQIEGSRRAGAIEKAWGTQWAEETKLLGWTLKTNLEGDRCNEKHQQAYIDSLKRLFDLLSYAKKNPPSESVVTRWIDTIRRQYGLTIGNPDPIIVATYNVHFEAYVATYLQAVLGFIEFKDEDKVPCKEWVQLPEEWGINIDDFRVTPSDEEGEPKPDVPDEFVCMIREVLDGDTVRIRYEDEHGAGVSDTVRLVGINSPETSKSKKQKDGSYINYPAEPFAQESKVWLAKKIGGLHGVTIRVDPTIPRDATESKRILGAIFVQDEYINLQSVIEGWSSYYPYSANSHVSEPEFMAAQDAAIEAKIGMWSGGYAELKVTSTPGRGQIFITGEDREVQTTHAFDLAPGTYEVTVKLEGHLDFTKSITLESNDEKELHFPLSEVTDTAEIYIASKPSDARIYLNGAETTVKTPETIKLKKENLGGEDSGTIKLGLKLKDHKDYETDITISLGESKRFEVTLEEEDITTGQIRVSSKPSDAKIFIDDIDTNKLTTFTFDKKCKETYKVTLKPDDFEDFVFDAVWVYCDDVVQLHHKFKEEETVGKLKVISSPPYADIFKEGTKIGTANMPAIDVTPGTYQFTFRKRDRKDQTAELTIKLSHQTNFYVELTESDPTKGGLYISSDPPKAAILLKDPEGVTKTVGYTTTTVTDLPPGTYTVTLSKNKHHPVSTTATVIAGETTQVFEELEEIKMNSGLNIKSSPSDAKIFIDDIDTGYTTTEKIDLEPRDAPYVVSVQMDKFHPYIAKPIVVANKYRTVYAKLEPLADTFATIKVTSSPSTAYIKVDQLDVFRITTSTIKVTPGPHIISVSKRGFVTQEQSITVAAATHYDLPSFDLEKVEEEEDTGMEIKSSPSNALISIVSSVPEEEGEEGEPEITETGRLTPEVMTKDPGTYTIQVSRDGWHPMTKTIRVTQGEITEEFFDLEEIETEKEKEKREKEEEEEAAKVFGVPEGWPWTLAGTGESQSEAGGMSSLFKGGEEEEDEDDTKDP